MNYFLIGLTLIFITLKLLGHITWSWWLVLLPLILWFGIGILILIAAFASVYFVQKEAKKKHTDFFK